MEEREAGAGAMMMMLMMMMMMMGGEKGGKVEAKELWAGYSDAFSFTWYYPLCINTGK